MVYTIKKYSYKQAKKLGVTIQSSTRKNKKIDVYKNGKKVASVGALGYGDYPTFMETEGKTSANIHRKKYKMRHEKDRHVPDSTGFYADNILW